MGQLNFVGTFTENEKSHLKQNLHEALNFFGDLTLDRSKSPTEVRTSQGHHLSFDFDENRSDYHRKPRGAQEPLLKALGFSKGIRKVLDLSMGLAIDSVFMARAGMDVVAVERNPLLTFLALEGQKKSESPVIKKISFNFSNAKEFLDLQSYDQTWSAYFDPMYPHKKKRSALPRQEMVFFRGLVGDDEDASEVLQHAIKRNFYRIVVKRPVQAEPLLPRVSFHIETKLVRFDVYTNLGIPL